MKQIFMFKAAVCAAKIGVQQADAANNKKKKDLSAIYYRAGLFSKI